MKDILVGINYFAGWWEPLPNKWHRHKSSMDVECGDDWRKDFPERVPLLGCFNTQETMDKEINAAADHGVDFFVILWYYNERDNEREPNTRFLNDGLKQFAASPNSHRMQFFIEFCNHPPHEVQTESQWQECLDAWAEVFSHSSYMTVGERLVFKIHGAEYFIHQNKDCLKLCRARLDSLRATAKQVTGREMIIGGGVMATDRILQGHNAAQLFDFTCTYMDIPPLHRTVNDYPYEPLADLARASRQVHCHDTIPYMPYIAGGWNPRPWPDNRACFEFPNKKQWHLELQRMKEDILNFPNLGLPLPDKSLQPAFNCYAWNEFGEGGILAPTQGDQYMKLEGIRTVFNS